MWRKFFINKIIIIPLVLVIFALSIPFKAEAGPGLPFGGQILSVIPCLCSANLLITMRPIGPLSPPQVIFGPSSILFPFYQLWRPGAYLLGNYGPPVPCVVFAIICVPISVAPLILMTGTSM